MSVQNSILGALLTENAILQGLDPLLTQKMCDENEASPQTESSDTYPSKILYTPPHCIFGPLNSHFSLTWF